ncbi:MAG TPA: serine--tRNA ligase [Acidimicrobiia bacterium]|nr:serine--tRNA ligase [Acidimicrobiia bacterium]
MIDIALLRDTPEVLAEALRRRHVDLDVTQLAAVDEERRRVRTRAEELRAEQKQAGQRIAELQGEEKQEAIAAAGRLADEYKALLSQADDLDARFEGVWMTLPNPAHDSVPDGATDADNVEVSTWGTPPEFDFEPRDHLDLGEALDIIDVDRAAKVSGSRFAYLKGAAVRLEFALVQWAMNELIGHGFTPVAPPVLVRDESLYGTGFFPGTREQVYAVGASPAPGEIEADDLYLAGTAEIPLAGYHSNEILDEEQLPIRFVGFSTCFRREAGTYGKDTRGIFRVHQFDKLEMFTYVHPDRSWEEHEFLREREEALVRALGLPYRVVNVCVGDLGDPAAKKYDIEAWMPGQGAYREITSCSNTTDFQSRRLRIRYRSDGGTRFVHTLNGTAVAVGRTLVAILENHQRADGSIAVPEPLQPYLGAEVIGP